MNDPWRFIAFPVAAVTGYLISLGASDPVAVSTGLTPFASEIIVIGITGFFAGFMVDEVIPAYIEKISNNSGGGMGGGSDFDDSDLDFE